MALSSLCYSLGVGTLMLRIIEEALTFDDVLLVPQYSDITARDVTLHSRLTTGITMNIPLLSAAMDTVTESRLAIAIAQEGGIGIVHKSMTADQQAKEVWAVKKYESGVVKNPFTIEATATLRDLHEFTKANNISGFRTIHGKKGSNFVSLGPINQPLSRNHVEEVITECVKNKITSSSMAVGLSCLFS